MLARLYERFGKRYLLLCVVQVWVFSLLMCTVITLLLCDLYLEMPAHQTLPVYGLAILGTVAGLGTALVYTARRVTPPLQRWASGERTEENAPAAWEAATRATFTWPAVACVGCAIFTIPAELLVLHYGPIPDWQIFLVLAPVVQFGIVATSILAYFSGEAFLRPIVSDISRHLPRDFEPRGWTPRLRMRLLPTVLVVDIFASLLAGGLVSRASDPTQALVFSLLAGLAINLTFSLTWTLALAGSILGPVRNLSAAAGSIERGDLNTRVPVIGKDELTDLSLGFNRMVEGLEERQALHSAMSSYIDPLIAERVLAEGSRIEGEAAETTIMFIDIVGFTTMAESVPPADVVADLNDFFEIVIPIVERHGGHANKLLGDGLMAVFGVPQPLADHAARAVNAAHEIAVALQDRYEGQLKAGIGLNSGPVVVGSMGGGGKLDYTIIGDSVNVAARVEAKTRETGDAILMTEATQRLLPQSAPPVESRGAITVKGRREPLVLFAVRDTTLFREPVL
jgi:class 3 adenylate cyclase